MPLVRMSIETTPEQRDSLTLALIDAGALGVEERGPCLVVYAQTSEEKARFAAVASAFDPGAIAEGRLYEEQVEPDYDRAWLAALEPVQLASGLVLRPTTRAPAPRGEATIWYEPDVSFGSGEHATTRLAATMIAEFGGRFPGKRLLDVGTGTGVLSLVALRCGFSSVVAVDIDPICASAAQKNFGLNQMTSMAAVHVGSASSVEESFPFVCANIISSVLIEIGPDLLARTAQQGRLLLTGLLTTELSEVLEFFSGLGLVLELTRTLDDWCLLVLTRADAEPRHSAN